MTTSPDSSTNNIATKTRKKHKTLKYCLVIIALFLLINFVMSVMSARSNVKMTQCTAYIYSLNSAISNYYLPIYGKYPQYQSEDGTELWSWRVALEGSRFTSESPEKRFHRDEPWNSEHNRQAIEQSDMDEYFVCPCRRSKDKRATYVAVTGSGTAWTEISKGNVKNPKETCRDMILFIETTEPKNHWAEPGDDVSPDEVIRLFQADPGLVKDSKPWFKIKRERFSTPVFFCREGHWPKFFATVGGSCELFSEIKDVEELRKRLYVPEEYLINKPVQ